MRHYSIEKWIEYIYVDEYMSEDDKRLMEKHLLSCRACLEKYINVLEEKETQRFEEIVPGDFVNRVMKEIDQETPRATNRLLSRKNVLIYYTAAACITLVLMGSGVFNLAIKSITSTTAAIVRSPIRVEASMQKLKLTNLSDTAYKITNIFKEK